MDHLPGSVRRAYEAIADDPKYQHFVRIPDRIIECIDYFGVPCDHTAVRATLHSYYLFIGAVDDAIDSGRIEAGDLILEYLSTPAPAFDDAARSSSVRLTTEILKFHISSSTHPVMLGKLRALYREVVGERKATSIDSYLTHRKSVGALTAELSYLLIRPDLGDHNDKLCEFMKQVGAVGCLIDSLIDLNKDRRLGLLEFRPRIMDYARLILSIGQNGAQLSLRHPGLSRLFLAAVADNVRDRFRSAPDLPQHSFASQRKDEAASVA